MCDLVVAGPSPLELCFGDLPRVPRPGEELLCRQLEIRPRSAALTALAAGRLGLRTALWSPFADDFPGRYLKGLLEDGGVRWYIVEHDRPSMPSLESARRSLQNLQRMGK